MAMAVRAISSSNPFERLRPTPRSEEDDIRKGIFGQALRLLYSAPDEEKLRWRHAIEATAALKSAPQRKKQQQQQTTTVEESNNNIDGSDGVAPPGVAASLKRPREEGSGETDQNQQRQGTGCANDSVTAGTNSHSSDHTAADTSAPRLSDTEFIAAYLRTLLDKVVGLSLLELHVDALRVLCVMLSIPLPTSRSKMTHYSTLASFYYTHCEKLGKRVSSSRHLEAQLKLDEPMLRKIYSKASTPNVSAASVRAKSGTAKPTTEVTSEAPTKQLRTSTSSRTVLGAVDGNVATSANATRVRRRNSEDGAEAATRTQTSPPKECAQATGESEEDDHEQEEHVLEVQHNGKVFATAAGTKQQQQQQQPSSSLQEDEDEDDEWSMAQLEQKVASVVHLYDPVTSAVVVKKLAQMGYRSPRAAETVEAILRSFHQRQFVFYDNGIAYLL
ncbi:hypothetical protein DQ04_01991010 [Trypanosoma grayi]|uniref:hypothetical protein n=1 Tax=Trypanosoma grayi TaxID=71804 RepID=UPI0004F4A375|nr:hypothetical protein DQ04_01991010 [Trypanosoma grayi]KEG12112.1 hypothetical protein DQ04_01991010 [Trypanosoma grayi]